MQPLTVTLTQTPQALIAALAGEVVMANTAEFEAHLKDMLQRKPRLVVLDLSKLTMVASCGLGLLVRFRRDVGATGGKVRLAAVDPLVLEALRRALFHKLFEICGTVDEACAVA